jgi:hypothetical protein
MTIGQLGHRPGLHVEVNVEGSAFGGMFVASEQWVPGKVVGLGGDGTYVTIAFDTPVGAGKQTLIQVDDPARVRPLELVEVNPGGVPDSIIQLVQAGKQLEAIKQYRALNGATLDEARAAIAQL